MMKMAKTNNKRKVYWTHALGLAVLLLVLLSCRSKEEPVSPPAPGPSAEPSVNSISEEERAEGWVLLFDGRTLDGWRGIGRDEIPAGHWIVEEDAIKKVSSGDVPRQADGQPIQGGDLMTVRTYGDFELRLEWRINPGGNSGIKYNVSEEMSISVPPQQAAIGFEYQIIDDSVNPDALVGPNRSAAALYDLIAPQNKTLKSVGEWNEARVVFRGRHGEHWLNGQKVLEFDLGTPEMNGFIAASKYRDIPGFGEKRRGHIVLQDHGDAVWFRNIKVREDRRL
jgi:hypothetical protein